MSLKVDIRHSVGGFELDVSFESQGRLTTIFGASGSGKTTVVNAIAGLISPQSTFISLDGQILSDSSRHINLPAHRRRIGYVFQDSRLFPHLTVLQNLKYGQWFTPEANRYAKPDQIIDLLGIGELLNRKPAHLSGGEKQRVAIGRALLSSPRLLLMDEPLAALDQQRKQEILPHIERLRDELKIPIVYVSHSVAEVARLATDIIVMADGRVAASGSAYHIMQRLDLIPADESGEGGAIIDMTAESFDATFGMTSLRSEAGKMYVPGQFGPPGSLVRLRIRARDVMIATSRLENISALNILHGRITRLEESSTFSITVDVDCSGSHLLAHITRQSASSLDLKPGMAVYAVVKAVSVAGAGPQPR
jgi:molybdate transport system ATP-binding protein